MYLPALPRVITPKTILRAVFGSAMFLVVLKEDTATAGLLLSKNKITKYG